MTMIEISTPIAAEDLDLAPVFGELDDRTKERVLDELRRADAALAAVRDELGLEGEGLTLEQYPSGQTEVVANLKGAEGKLSFEAGLRPRNFFSETPWQPGHAPRSMMTDAWDVDGYVRVMVRRLVGTHKYTIQETAEEIEERRFEDAVEAAAALASVCDELAALARSREPTVAAWEPPEESSSG
ncbi:MAG TPA: hypothetical protein VFB42_13615 [Gaiellaceae bacterium]|nr:hypothetical protein [Gaiellaceae bacterium]